MKIHRLKVTGRWSEGDLVRLFQVLALRSLGLTRDSIRVCLDGDVGPTRLVRLPLGPGRARRSPGVVTSLDKNRWPLHTIPRRSRVGRPRWLLMPPNRRNLQSAGRA